MRVNTNLASQPYEDAPQFWLRWGGALLALGVLTLSLIYLTSAGWVSARQDRDLIKQREAQITVRDNQRVSAQAMMDLPQNRSTRDRSEFLNDLFQRKTFSWTRAFEDLEPLMPPQLHVVSIHPETTPDNEVQIKLTVTGASRDRALELVRKMEGSQRFQQTEIDEERISTTQGTTEVIFNITALYVPPTAIVAQPNAPTNSAKPAGATTGAM
jgi:type IV pilus assembly protein PilN